MNFIVLIFAILHGVNYSNAQYAWQTPEQQQYAADSNSWYQQMQQQQTNEFNQRMQQMDFSLKANQQMFEDNQKRLDQARVLNDYTWRGDIYPKLLADANVPYKDPTPFLTFILGESNAFPNGRPN